MKSINRPVKAVSIFLVVLALAPATVQARDGDEKPLIVAAAQSSKDKRMKACRIRYRDCLNKNQIPSFECQYIYQDCIDHIF